MRYPREQWVTDPKEVDTAKKQARELFHRGVRNVVLGTVGNQGDAHTTVLSRNFHQIRAVHPEVVDTARPIMYFWSFWDTRHVQNIWERPDQTLRVQLLDSGRNAGALALRGVGRMLHVGETEVVLPAFNAERAKLKEAPPKEFPEFLNPDYPRAMVQIDFTEAEVPVRAYDPAGHWADDIAVGIGFEELLMPPRRTITGLLRGLVQRI